MSFLNGLKDLLLNDILLVPIITSFIAQLLKLLINGVVNKSFKAERLWGDGGMPSAHSATVVSLALMCGFCEGFGSAYFAIAAMFAFIVMHDALGVRRETGKQAVSIIEMAELFNAYFAEKDEEIKTDKLKTLVGHTPTQVVCGALVGLVVVLLYLLIFKGIFGFPL
ncbi:MAG: divergent PAP2 family protein [Clostridia bacterium]|nr:divergent PAP2 family protein [Clostridia bacterium]